MDARFEAVLIEQCAPTLARVKPASLFRYQPEDSETIGQTIAYWTAELARCGLTLCVLKQCAESNAVLIYLYRADWVASIVEQAESRRFLIRMGYQAEQPLDALLAQLAVRFTPGAEFPHEIGLFLGYPLCDVVGFVENKGRNYTYCGQWKCYGDAQEAKKRFERLRKCTTVYKRLYENGTPVLRLIVAA